MTDRNHSGSLGIYLHKLRMEKSVSLREVEKETKIPKSWIARLEMGARNKWIARLERDGIEPTPERLKKLKKLARYYSVSINELMEKAAYVNSPVEWNSRKRPDIKFKLILEITMPPDGTFSVKSSINTSKIPECLKFMEVFENIYDVKTKGVPFPMNGKQYRITEETEKGQINSAVSN